MRRRTLFRVGLALLISCLTISSGCEVTVPPLRIGTLLWPGYEPFYLANQLGYYQHHPIHFIDYPSQTEVMRAYRNGEIDGVTLTFDQILALAETDPDTRAVLVTDISDGGDVLLSRSEIRTLQELKGKRLGLETTALGSYFLTLALQTVDLTIQDLQLVDLKGREVEQAFQRGMVDAVVTYEPYRSSLMRQKARLLFDSSQIPGAIIDGLAVRQATIEHQTETLQGLFKGWFQALDYMSKYPQESTRQIARHQGTSPEDVLQSFKLIQIPDLAENLKLFGDPNSSLYLNVERLSRLMAKTKLLKQAIDPKTIISDRPLNQL
jgi:NitT/TauT family transport system substrate-binding protein